MSHARRAGVLPLVALLAACNPFMPEDPRFAEGIGQYDGQKFEEAEKTFDDAVKQEPSSEGSFGKGASLYQQKKFAEASDEFRKAISSPDEELRARAWFDLGNARAKANDMKGAIDAYRRSLALAPDDPDARYNLEWALLQKQQQDKGKPQGGDSDDKQKDDQEKDQKDGPDQQAKNEGSKAGDSKDGEQKPDGQKDGDQKGQEGENGDQQAQNEPGKDQQQQGDQQDPNKDGKEQGAQQQADGTPNGEQKEDPAGTPQGDGTESPEQQARAMSQQDVGEVLDALQAGEKSFQLWKFQQKGNAKRSNVEKDW